MGSLEIPTVISSILNIGHSSSPDNSYRKLTEIATTLHLAMVDNQQAFVLEYLERDLWMELKLYGEANTTDCGLFLWLTLLQRKEVAFLSTRCARAEDPFQAFQIENCSTPYG